MTMVKKRLAGRFGKHDLFIGMDMELKARCQGKSNGMVCAEAGGFRLSARVKALCRQADD